MSIDADLILPPDVDIFSIRDLAPSVRASIDAVDEDYAITRGRSRGPSRIIDKQNRAENTRTLFFDQDRKGTKHLRKRCTSGNHFQNALLPDQ